MNKLIFLSLILINAAASYGKTPRPIKKELSYYPPLSVYERLYYFEDGVTFEFHGKNEIRASGDGKVSYIKKITDNRTCIIIEHGDNNQTLILGPLDYIVKEGDNVSDTQVIGYTNPKLVKNPKDSSIFFEILKNYKAQDTFLFLDKSTLLKNISNEHYYH